MSASGRLPGGTGAHRAEVPRIPGGRPRAHGSHRQAHRLRVAHLSDLHYGPRHLEEADRCTKPGEVGALMRAIDDYTGTLGGRCALKLSALAFVLKSPPIANLQNVRL